MKYRKAILLVFLIILADQALKFYIKTHYYYQQDVNIIGHWFKLHFIENEGMAFGMTINHAQTGKVILTLFRLAAVIFGFYYVNVLVKKQYNKGTIICASLILAGALGNLLDSMFYGLIFTESTYPFHLVNGTFNYASKLVPFGHGYGKFLHGKVVDMLYFPIIDMRWPRWIPFIGGNEFEFFAPVFNIADASISVGVMVLLFFQKRLVHKKAMATPVTE